MPNLRLTRSDVAIVLRYIDEESRGVERRAAAAAPSVPSTPSAPELPAARPARVVVTEAMAAPLHGALARYDALRARLAADDLEGARSLAATMEPRLGTAADFSGGAKKIAAAQDLAAARVGFGELSRDLIAILADNPMQQQGFWLFRCPMAPGYQKWLQADGKLTNPYWGKRMLTCGSQVASWSI